MKKFLLFSLLLTIVTASYAKKSDDGITLLSGSPEVIFEHGKFAYVEFDYSDAQVVEKKDSYSLEDYLDIKDEKYRNDWSEVAKKAEANFIESFNSESEGKTIRIISNKSKAKYKIVVHIKEMSFGKLNVAKMILINKQTDSKLTSEIEIIDLATNDVVCKYSAKNVKGQSSLYKGYSETSRICSCFAETGGNLVEQAEDDVKHKK